MCYSPLPPLPPAVEPVARCKTSTERIFRGLILTVCRSVPVATITVYSGDARKRAAGENRKRASCTVTKTTTRKYGETLILVPAGVTSTYTAYTDFSMATVTETTYRGTKHIIATETATTSSVCGPATTSIATWTSTVSLDRRCAPAAMTVDGNGFGIDWLSDVPSTGATYETETENASFCCQLCAETDKCAASAWDIRNGRCKLEFPTAWDTGELSCGQGLLGYYAAGPNHPMSPGAGWYISELCGWVQLTNAKPDDGS